MFSLSEIGNVSTVEHVNVHTDFHVFGFNIELLVFYSTLPAKFLEYIVSKESSFRFKGISVSAFCLLSVPQGFHFIYLLIHLRIFYHNWQQNHQDIISSVCCYQAARRKGKFRTYNKFYFTQNMPSSACRLHFQDAIYCNFDFPSMQSTSD